MGTFNVLADAVPEVCPQCGAHIRRSVQFHWGFTRQLTYQMGDRLTWDDPGSIGNQGVPGVAVVVVEGYPELCPVCRDDGPDDLLYDVRIEDDVVVAAERASGEYPTLPEGFVVLEW